MLTILLISIIAVLCILLTMLFITCNRMRRAVKNVWEGGEMRKTLKDLPTFGYKDIPNSHIELTQEDGIFIEKEAVQNMVIKRVRELRNSKKKLSYEQRFEVKGKIEILTELFNLMDEEKKRIPEQCNLTDEEKKRIDEQCKNCVEFNSQKWNNCNSVATIPIPFIENCGVYKKQFNLKRK